MRRMEERALAKGLMAVALVLMMAGCFGGRHKPYDDPDTGAPPPPLDCLDDGDCNLDQICTLQACSPICSGDQDCLQGERCTITGRCTPLGDCPLDSYEDNDTLNQAPVIPFDRELMRLALCDMDDDWFALAVQGLAAVTVTARFAHADGDLDMEVYGPDGETLVAEGISSDDDEVVVVPTSQDGTYYILLYRIYEEVDRPPSLYSLIATAGGDPGPCGSLTSTGECNGSALRYCWEGEVVEKDCAAHGMECDLALDEGYEVYDCISNVCGEITYEGECRGDVLVYCNTGHTVSLEEIDCGESALTCGYVDEEVGYDCLPPDSCEGLTYEGECQGNLLRYCYEGVIEATNCEEQGQECQYVSFDRGYDCVEPASSGGGTVSGQVRFEKARLTQSGLGSADWVPARRCLMEVVDESSGETLASGLTDEQGHYELTFSSTGQAYVRASTTIRTTTHLMDVLAHNGAIHAFRSDAAANLGTVNLDITEGSGAAGAFNVFDVYIDAIDFTRANFGDSPPLLTVFWEEGSNTPGGTSYFVDRDNEIYLLGTPQDRDEYDDPVILHEFGHFAESCFSRSDSPGGYHDGSPTDPRLAWGEGYGTFFGSVVTGSPIYIDSNSGGAMVMDLENMDSWNSYGWPDGALTQRVSEELVMAVLWDIYDNASDGLDHLSSGSQPAFDVMGAYFRSPSFDSHDRGVRGVDLVDFLDGWFCRGHGSRDAMSDIVVEERGFPYDFAGVGSCP